MFLYYLSSILLHLIISYPVISLSSPLSLRLTVFPTTTFSRGNFAPSPSVSILPAPININDINGEYFPDYCSARLEGTITAPTSGNYTLFVETEGGIRIWIDDHLIVNDMWLEGLFVRNTTTLYPAILVGERATPIRIEYQHNLNTPRLSLFWNSSNGLLHPSLVPASALSSDVRDCEDSRWALRDRLSVESPIQWQTSWIDHAGMHVHSPSRFGIPFTLAEPSTLSELVGGLRVFSHNNPAYVRYGRHSIDGSNYTQLNISRWEGRRCDVSIETTVVNDGVDLLVLITSSGQDCAKLVILSQPIYLWNAAGWLYNVAPGRIDAWRPGFTNFSYFSAQTVSAHFPLSGPFAITVSLNSSSPIGFSVSKNAYNYSLTEISSSVAIARSVQALRYESFGELAEVYEAIETIISWNTIFSAVVGPFTCVSRIWNWGSEQTLLFDWDTYFVALQASTVGAPSRLLDVSFANLLAITLTRTWTPEGENGFVPNIIDFQQYSTDRSEPQVGATVFLRVLERNGGISNSNFSWIIDYLWPTLYSWADWAWNRRRGEGVLSIGTPDGYSSLLCLGSDFPTIPASDGGAGTESGARGESGEDNGPEYDTPPLIYNISTGHLEIYSVQSTSHFLADVEALIKIANATGRTNVLPLLMSRFNQTVDALNQYLWDPIEGIYTNRMFNGTFYPRRSPTAFYPLISGAASDSQADKMMSFLTSPEFFCVNNTNRGPINSSMLIHYFSQKTNGSLLCVTEDCLQDSVTLGEFYWKRVEALVYSLDAGSSSSLLQPITLTQWFNAKLGVFALTGDDSSTPPSLGYTFIRQEGLCSRIPTNETTIPLDLYVLSKPSGDYMYQVCATSNCITEAISSGFTRNSTICYVLNATGWENLPCKYGVVPSIARSDPAWNLEADTYNYWRGRIWGPQVLLVYLGLQRYDHVPSVRAARLVLVSEAKALLLRDWRYYRRINENYNSITGSGSDNQSSDPSYHWGSLLAFISLLENGF